MSIWADNGGFDYEHRTGLKFVEVTLITAAVVRHTCTTCKNDIQIGERYRREVCMSIGQDAPFVTKECMDCY